MQNIKTKLTSRFLQYVKTYTTSNQENADKGIIPSTPQQMDFARKLEAELKQFNPEKTEITSHAYLYASFPASKGYENTPSIAFLAHMDTVSEVPGEHVLPTVIDNYDGSKLTLSTGIILDPKTDKYLADAKGETIVVTDGSTLLGADDKAGIAIIMTALEVIYENSDYKHGPIEVIFSPDEETGHGMDFVPLDLLKSRYAYTFDGGHDCEIENECFNAYKSEITFIGKAKHTGTARPDMINAITMATSFLSLLPQNESPEATDNYQGFYAPMEVSGHIEKASILLYLRDFSMENMKKRINTIDQFAEAIRAKFNGAEIIVKHTQQYLNMKDKLNSQPEITEKLVQAVKKTGKEPCFNPIRGGTDGSRLTEMGIPTPNVFTGGHNFHSRTEWASIDQMMHSVQTLLELIQIWTEK